MESRLKEIKVYVAFDGTEFLTEQGATNYENAIKDLAIYQVKYGPDTTEGRHGPNKSYYFAVKAESYAHDLLSRHYCYKSFGSPCAFVQNSSPIPNWTLVLQPDLTNVSEVKEVVYSSGKIIKFQEYLGKYSPHSIKKWGG